jgi:hypothetical protein
MVQPFRIFYSLAPSYTEIPELSAVYFAGWTHTFQS